MPNGPLNPLVAPLQAMKQIGEQANMGIQSLGTGLAQTASMGLDTLMSAAPALPGVPGVAAGVPGVPGLPNNIKQVLSQVENVIIPAGLPRLSQMAPQPPAQQQPPAPQPLAQQPQVARRAIKQLGGYS